MMTFDVLILVLCHLFQSVKHSWVCCFELPCSWTSCWTHIAPHLFKCAMANDPRECCRFGRQPFLRITCIMKSQWPFGREAWRYLSKKYTNKDILVWMLCNFRKRIIRKKNDDKKRLGLNIACQNGDWILYYNNNTYVFVRMYATYYCYHRLHIIALSSSCFVPVEAFHGRVNNIKATYGTLEWTRMATMGGLTPFHYDPDIHTQIYIARTHPDGS